MAEAIIDGLEMVEIDHQHGGRTGIPGVALHQLVPIQQERAAVGDPGERIDHRCRPMSVLDTLLRHGQQNEGN
jgi:hypothetical protein